MPNTLKYLVDDVLQCSGVLKGFAHWLDGQLMHLDVWGSVQNIHDGIGHILRPQHGQFFVSQRYDLGVHQSRTDAL